MALRMVLTSYHSGQEPFSLAVAGRGNATHCRITICDGLSTTGRAWVQEVIEALVLGVEPGVAAAHGAAGVPGYRLQVPR